ncbi:MAG TPA: hypothetical protein PKD90_05710 [Phnomibacter sp.]|nr:hypothetical protein [Lacibacter sp.]HMO90379.1 hypothetical protein [Lacibacter sp.]HMP92347.1 hypothetical protein [Phnomibacter sp.]
MTQMNLELTGIFVQDPQSKGYTAFFAQLPNIIAEGDNEEDALNNLVDTVREVFQHLSESETTTLGHTPTNQFKTKQFNFTMA